MIDDFRFFQDFFDGQIVSKEGEKFNLFRLMLFSIISALGFFVFLAGYCGAIELLLLELGMFWNIYSRLSKKLSLVLGILVGLFYFYFACNFAIYAHALIYVACYLPFQLIAVSAKDYEDGDFIQVKKHVTDYNKILLVTFFAVIAAAFTLFDFNFGARFILLDSISAALLVCSALLRNERYFEYYLFRILALLMSIALWIFVAMEYGAIGTIAIILMYMSYLVYDVVCLIYQNVTYKNEYMLVCEEYNKQLDDVLIDKKLKIYSEVKKSDNKNK